MSELNKAQTQAQPSSPSSFLERLCCPSKENQIKDNTNLNNMFKEAKPNMDENNSKAADVFIEKGIDEGFKNLFTNPKTGKPMSYAESRMLYG